MAAKRSTAGPGRRKPRKQTDVALIFDRTSDQEGFHLLRRRSEDAPIELGTIRPLREGKPIDGEVVSLRPRREAPWLCDVKTELTDTRRATSDGPAQVASSEYRRGWDLIWGKPGTGSDKPN